MKQSALIALGLVVALTANADIKPHALFCDHAVLQQGKPVPVWGEASPGERVTVTLGDQKVVSTTGDDGRWSVRLPEMKAGGPHSLVIEGKNKVVLHDVWVGEVWVCSGQSNMGRSLGVTKPKQRKLENSDQEIASADYPQIRHFRVLGTPSDSPQYNIEGSWEVCSPQTVSKFTAVGYYFGRDLHKKLNVPIGLINNAAGGTCAETWTSHELLAADFPGVLTAHAKAVKNYVPAPAKDESGQASLPKAPATEEPAETDSAAVRPANLKSKQFKNPLTDVNRPSALFNGTLAPIIPYAIRGVIWYQGEANVSRAKEYTTLFPELIRDWRTRWGQGDYPFLFVQLAPCRGTQPAIRDAQYHAWQTTPSTAMVVTTDVGDANDIHPTRKEPVGARLALAARALAYGENIEYSGPEFSGISIEGSRVIVHFKHLGGGLVAQGGPLRGFTISGGGQTFVPADAEIVGETVVVHAESVPKPVSVRYGWDNVPDVNLFNGNGLPASPFRSDTSEEEKIGRAEKPGARSGDI